ncbi:4-(cytidine 5'-diphospho)-2-C-methyl-D-erythritol kinase [Peptoniphilus asaccharolyticus]
MKSYAKINLSLDVVSKREDGYHNIASIMQRIDIYDEMEIEKSEKFNFDSDMELPEENTVTKAYRVLTEYMERDLPVSVKLHKNIPIGAGLAGGSANAATLFEEINRIYDLNLSTDDLRKLGVKVGADVPFMIGGETALCEGIGDLITDLDINFSKLKALIINPGFEISSKEVYSQMNIRDERIDFKSLEMSLKNGNLTEISKYLRNDMENVVFKKYKEVENIKEELLKHTQSALMSGSGSTVYGLFDNEDDLKEAYDKFKKLYKNTYMVNLI